MITIRALSGAEYLVPVWNPDETILQWQERIAPFIKENAIICQNGHRTFVWKLVQNNILFNIPALRNDLMSKYCDETKPILAVLWGFNPSDAAQMKGNLDKNEVETALCAICCEPLTYSLSFDETMQAFDECLHRFHWLCLANLKDNDGKYLCPICRIDVTHHVAYIKNHKIVKDIMRKQAMLQF